MTVPFEHLEPYFELAYSSALNSPCIRRKYGAVIAIAGTAIEYGANWNQRVNDKCCGGSACIRDRIKVSNGERTEVGGEIHAETAVLIDTGRKREGYYFILAGFDNKGNRLYGTNAYPCHACAMAIKYAGYKNIYLEESPGQIQSYSVSRILEERMQEWLPEI